MFYVGLDIHTKHISICALNETGQVVRRTRVRGIQEMLGVLSGLPDRFEVCYEASCGYGHFHDLLCPLAARVLVAHPGQLRLIFRSCVVKWLMWRSAGSFGRLWGSARLGAT
jgi:transposase